MALIDPNKRIRLDIPHEEGQWIEIRPITVRVINAVRKSDNPGDYGTEIVRNTITGWSYEAPFTLEAIDDLDYTTFDWLVAAINVASGIKGEAEKKESTPDSPSGPPPPPKNSKPERSPQSSGT